MYAIDSIGNKEFHAKTAKGLAQNRDAKAVYFFATFAPPAPAGGGGLREKNYSR
jgi:hypothetical protein